MKLVLISGVTEYRDPLHHLLDYIAESTDCDMVLIHDDDLERIDGIGDATTLRSDVLMDLLRRSDIEICKVDCNLSPSSGHSNTDTGVIKVALLSMIFQNWRSLHAAQNAGVHRVDETSEACPPTVPNTSPVLAIRPSIDGYKKQGDDHCGSCPQVPGSDGIIQQQHSLATHEDIPALELQQAPQLKRESALSPPLEKQASFMDVKRLGQFPSITFSPPSGISASAPPVLASIGYPDEQSGSALPPAPQPCEVVAQRKRVPTSPRKGDRSSSRYALSVCNKCRAQKVRCDGGRPTCSNCAIRSSICSYDAVSSRSVPTDPIKGYRSSTRYLAVACDHCRVRKSRCDGARPCSICCSQSLVCTYGTVSSGPVSVGPSPASTSAFGDQDDMHHEDQMEKEGVSQRVKI